MRAVSHSGKRHTQGRIVVEAAVVCSTHRHLHRGCRLQQLGLQRRLLAANVDGSHEYLARVVGVYVLDRRSRAQRQSVDRLDYGRLEHL